MSQKRFRSIQSTNFLFHIVIVNNKTKEIIKDDNYDKHNLNNIIEWWKKKATNRYNNLKNDNRLRRELEIWSPNAKIEIIR